MMTTRRNSHRNVQLAMAALGVLMVIARPAAAQIASRPDTTGLELQVGAFTLANRWHALDLDGAATSSVQLQGGQQGIELLLAPRLGGFGVHGRIASGTSGGRRLTLREAGVILGTVRGGVELGYGTRSTIARDTTVAYATAGVRINAVAGRSGIHATFAGSGMIPVGKKQQPASLLRGWQGETALSYDLPRLPAYVQVGFHASLLNFRAWSEQSTGLRVGAGIWMAGR